MLGLWNWNSSMWSVRKVFQAGGDLGLHVGLGQGAAFGGQDEVIPQARFFQRLADPFLADRVGAGSVDVVDARLMGSDEQFPRAGLVDALNRDAAKPQAGNFQAGLTKVDVLHSVLLLLCCGALRTPPLQISVTHIIANLPQKSRPKAFPGGGKANRRAG